MRNIAAFTRLYGVLRWFHPVRDTSAVDWNRAAIEGVLMVQSASDVRALRTALQRFTDAVAPGTSIGFGARERSVSRTCPGPYLFWQYRGFPGDNQHGGDRRLLQSNRPDTTWRVRRIPTSGQRLRVALGDGLSASVAQTLPVSPCGTETPPRLPVASDSDSVARAEARRIADVVIAWNVMHHFHPTLPDSAEFSRSLSHWVALALSATSDARVDDALRPLVHAIVDGHADLLPPAAIFRARPPTGFLPFYARRFGNEVVVTITRDSLVRVGDVIVSVDGTSALALTATDSTARQFGTPRLRETRLRIYSLAAGPRGSSTVRIRRGSRDTTVVLTRSAPNWRTVPVTDEYRIWHPPIAEVAPGIWYVDLTRVNGDSLAPALDNLRAARGIILDNRQYPMAPREVLGHFLRTPGRGVRHEIPVRVGPPGSPGNDWFEDRFTYDPIDPFLSAPVVMLSGPGAISRAETTLMFFREHRLGRLVGDTSAGANGGTNWFSTPSGYILTFSQSRVRWEDSRDMQGHGVVPDVLVIPTREGMVAGRDEALEAAVQLLQAAAPPLASPERPTDSAGTPSSGGDRQRASVPRQRQ